MHPFTVREPATNEYLDTDFIAAGGPGGYAWNVVRSEADELLFKHAAECGVKTFDETKVASIEFAQAAPDSQTPGRPVSATWTRKDGTSGTIAVDYIVDASGRAGVISTKYLKNRSYNQGLKNVASWGYWTNGGVHGVGTHKEGAPYFEALKGKVPSYSDWDRIVLTMRSEQTAVAGFGSSLFTMAATR